MSHATAIQLLHRTRLLIGDELNHARSIFLEGEKDERSDKLADIAKRTQRRFGVAAGIYFTLREMMSAEEFTAMRKSLAIDDTEEADLINAAIDGDGLDSD